MSQVPDEELISAYLDNEVTDDERAYVERLLADDPKSRALYEELRALRSSLQALPQQQLEPDFGDRVLARAERAMLLPSDPARQADPDHRSVPSDEAPSVRISGRLRRPLLWSALAVAAALLLMIFSPNDPREPEQQAIVQRPPEAETPQSARREAGEVIGPARLTRDLDDVEMLEKGSADGEEAPRESATTAAEVASPSRSANIEKSSADELRSREIILDLPIDKARNGLAAPVFRAAGFADARQVMIVRCDISPSAVRTKAFEKLLRDQKIAFEEAAETPSLALEETAAAEGVSDREKTISRNETARKRAANVAGGRIVLGRQEMVIVEATDDQLEATLAVIKNNPETFLAVSVDPAPAVPVQRVWVQRYNRGNVTAAAVAPSSEAALPPTEPARDAAKSEADTDERPPADSADRPASESVPRAATAAGILRQQVAETLFLDRQRQLQLQYPADDAQTDLKAKARARKVPFPASAGEAGAFFRGGAAPLRALGRNTAAKNRDAYADKPSGDEEALPRPVNARRDAGQQSHKAASKRTRTAKPDGVEPQTREAALSRATLKQAVFVLQVVDPEAVPSVKKKARTSDPAKPPS